MPRTYMKRTKSFVAKASKGATAAAAVTLMLMSPANAAGGLVADVGSSERINLAGQLATLSERVIASTCNINAGVALRASNAVLEISENQFARITDALLVGNRGFGILGEETRSATLRSIDGLNEAWEPIKTNALTVEPNAEQNDVVASVADYSAPLLEKASILVAEITGQYSDPIALLQADAMLIDIAGRQRMLSQRMSKEVCLIASGIDVDANIESLQNTVSLFDTSLSALINGMEQAGVRPPPTAEIEEGLQYVVAEWEAVQPMLQSALAGEELDKPARATAFFAFLGMEARMNNVVFMYAKNSKLGL